MLFNSYLFLFGFLPVVTIGFFLLARLSRLCAAGWLALASLVFYAQWNPEHVLLLLGSILFNYLVGSRLAQRPAKGLLVFGVSVDLALLAYFKYADFGIASLNAVFGVDLPLLQVILPIGISFFTFTQIAFLVDAWRGEAQEYNFVHYVLFVTYFPHLIAGPILHHKEMMPQFAAAEPYRFSPDHLSAGLALFTIGLAKKVLLADQAAPVADAIFAPAARLSLTLWEAWAGALAYTFQIYFDFSGYTDMALGLALMIGIRLPINFDSPYKAMSIIDFWRRWHMTLSRFLRDYLYIPLGGSRRGPARRYANLMITMLLGGLWHGAAWTFVIWGAAHGAMLMVNHAWQALFPNRMPARLSQALTFVCVVLAWVPFRAPDAATTWGMLRPMLGGNGLAMPTFMQGEGTFANGLIRGIETWPLLILLAAIIFLAPNSNQIMARKTDPGLAWGFAMGIVAVASLSMMGGESPFLYFQF